MKTNNIINNENVTEIFNILNKLGYKYRISKVGSIKVILKDNYYHDLKYANDWHHKLINKSENNKILTIGVSHNSFNGDWFTTRVSGPAFYSFTQKWETPVGKWSQDFSKLISYLSVYLVKKLSERDY